MSDAHSDPDDARAEALADRLAFACGNEPNHIVIPEMICALGERVGHFPWPQRQPALDALINQLRLYVSEIPPLPTDAYGGGPDAA